MQESYLYYLLLSLWKSEEHIPIHREKEEASLAVISKVWDMTVQEPTVILPN